MFLTSRSFLCKSFLLLLISSLLACGQGRDRQPEDSLDSENSQNPPNTPAEALTIAKMKKETAYRSKVQLEGLVISGISRSVKSNSGEDYLASFWVVDIERPSEGIFVEKYFTDEVRDEAGTLITGWKPELGAKISLEGFFGTMSWYLDGLAHRPVIRSDKEGGPLVIRLHGQMAPPEAVLAPADLGANPESASALAGVRVHVPGPLTLSNAEPAALARFYMGEQTGFNGFEVSGGILVNNFFTWQDRGEGTDTGCDFREDAAAETVTFPNGISGVWDTYSHAPCMEEGEEGERCWRAKGSIPGSTASFIHVLYPLNCSQDLAGIIE